MSTQLESKTALIEAIRQSEEEALINKAKELDADAWSEIYQRYYHKIYRYLYYRLGDRDIAEDLASSVFLEALEGIGRFTYRGVPFSAWLYRIAHNTAIDYRRRKGKERTVPLDDSLSTEEAELDESLQGSLTKQELAIALETLTDEQQQVILLKFSEGLSNAEIAKVIKKSEGAVKSLQHRALGSLRRILQEKLNE